MAEKKSREELEKELLALKRQVDALEQQKPAAKQGPAFEIPAFDVVGWLKVDERVKMKAPFVGILFVLFLFFHLLMSSTM